jgi:hypothetical protein
MKVLPSGHFSYTLEGPTLAKGLRSTSAQGRNSNSLILSTGAVGRDGVLEVLPTITLSTLLADPLVVDNDFPFPQIFTLDKHLIVCNRTTVLELVFSTLVKKATVVGGELWELGSADDFIYLSNGTVNLVRDPNSGDYTSSSIAPVCSAICNFNGQIICGNIR